MTVVILIIMLSYEYFGMGREEQAMGREEQAMGENPKCVFYLRINTLFSKSRLTTPYRGRTMKSCLVIPAAVLASVVGTCTCQDAGGLMGFP